jgi:hypothetical protein
MIWTVSLAEVYLVATNLTAMTYMATGFVAMLLQGVYWYGPELGVSIY